MDSQHERGMKMGSLHAEDNSYMPGLNDDVALLCLAKTSMAEYDKLFSINKRYLSLSQSGDLYKMRRNMGISEQWVFMQDSEGGDLKWRAFDPKSGMWRSLPLLPESEKWRTSDYICAGTQLLVYGDDGKDLALWRYELASNEWFKGHSMITSRFSFASATCANFTLVAGGFGDYGDRLKCAEKYDVEKGAWEPLPDMIRARGLCSGCLMDNRFYVIGGAWEDAWEDGFLNSGEFYDFEKNKWELISDMLPYSVSLCWYVDPLPPFVAVVNNELYAFETCTSQLKYYNKQTNKWEVIGQGPLERTRRGVVFKSLGDRLFLMGRSHNSFPYTEGFSIYTWCPEPNRAEANWHMVARDGGLVFTCAIMST